MDRVRGRTALISGGARGLGAAFAKALIDEGANVVIGDILDEEGIATADRLGPACRFVHLDVTQPADWTAAVDETLTAFGGLDILINNAGIIQWVPIEDQTVESFQRILDINLVGAYNGVKAAVEPLKRSGSGSIINISSSAGLKGFPTMTAYNASKWGVRGLTKALALELGKHNVRANSVHPGAVHTPMTVGMEENTRPIALNRLGEPEEIAALIVYLASNESSFSTGAEFLADGGELAGSVDNEAGDN